MVLDHFALSHMCDNCPVRVNALACIIYSLGIVLNFSLLIFNERECNLL